MSNKRINRVKQKEWLVWNVEVLCNNRPKKKNLNDSKKPTTKENWTNYRRPAREKPKSVHDGEQCVCVRKRAIVYFYPLSQDQHRVFMWVCVLYIFDNEKTFQCSILILYGICYYLWVFILFVCVMPRRGKKALKNAFKNETRIG